MKQYHLISVPPKSSPYGNLLIVSEISDTLYRIEERVKCNVNYIFAVNNNITKKFYDIEIIDSSDSIEEIRERAMMELL